jgi:hypothetical protein
MAKSQNNLLGIINRLLEENKELRKQLDVIEEILHAHLPYVEINEEKKDAE